MADTVSSHLGDLVRRGAIEADPAQADLARRLDALAAALKRKPSLFGKREAPRGLYIWGEVGRGKTLLMDTFFRLAPERRKRRAHFHAFMVGVHERMAAFRDVRGRQPVDALGEAIAKETRLLCLDEMQVKDIADAMLLGRLFETLIESGTVIVTTSNAPPAKLYEKGLNRDRFLPFIALIEKRLDVVQLKARTDFRLAKLEAAPVWVTPPDDAALDAAFRRLTGEATGTAETLRVQGRDLHIRNAAAGVARFGFGELCEAPLGPGDFGALARTYQTLLVDRIPQLDAKAPDAVRRFIILIDELYDQRVKLIASAETPPAALLTSGKQAEEFRRTASRLAEMGSKHWLALPHGQEADLNAAEERD